MSYSRHFSRHRGLRSSRGRKRSSLMRTRWRALTTRDVKNRNFVHENEREAAEVGGPSVENRGVADSPLHARRSETVDVTARVLADTMRPGPRWALHRAEADAAMTTLRRASERARRGRERVAVMWKTASGVARLVTLASREKNGDEIPRRLADARFSRAPRDGRAPRKAPRGLRCRRTRRRAAAANSLGVVLPRPSVARADLGDGFMGRRAGRRAR